MFQEAEEQLLFQMKKETEAEAEEETTADKSAMEDTVKTSRTEDEASTHGKESECLNLYPKKFIVKKTRISSEERSKAHTSATDGRSQLADPLHKQERLRQALMSGQAD